MIDVRKAGAFAQGVTTVFRSAFVQSAGAVFFLNCIGTALGVGCHVGLTRTLGVDGYGIYTYALAWANGLALVALLGTDGAAVRFVAGYFGTRKHGILRAFVRYAHFQVSVSSLAVGSLVAGLLFIFRAHIPAAKLVPFWIGCALVPANALVLLGTSILQGLQKVVLVTVAQGAVRPAGFIIVLVAVWASRGGRLNATWGLSMNLLFSVALYLWCLRLAGRTLRPACAAKVDNCERAEWRSTSRSLFGITMAQFLLGQADVLILGAMLGTTESGIYSVASRLAAFVTFGINAINSVLAPAIAELHAKGDYAGMRAMLKTAAWCVLAYSVPVMLLLVVAGRYLLGIFGPSFQSAYWCLLVLGLGQLVVCLCGSVGFLLTMTGNHAIALKVIGSSAAGSVVLILLLTPALGSIGAALGIAFATSVRSISLLQIARKRLGVSPSLLVDA
jgi:O-antigen/teichoic acid export membrane protein